MIIAPDNLCLCVTCRLLISLMPPSETEDIYIYIIDPPLKVIKIHVMYSCCRLTFSPCEEH